MKLFRPTIIGRENLKEEGSIILAGNHTHFLDCVLLISSTKRTIHFLAKKELHDSKFGKIFELMATIPVNRKTKDHEALNKAVEVLNDGHVIGIFPEGTINRTEDIIMPFKYGAVSMAQKTGSYIIPFSITGKYKIFRKNITICFGKKYLVEENLTIENKKLENKVKELLIKNKV